MIGPYGLLLVVPHLFAVPVLLCCILSTVGDALRVPREGLGRLQIVGIAGKQPLSWWHGKSNWWLGCGAAVPVDKCATVQLNPFDVIMCTVGVSVSLNELK
jgi:hypothetical protein